MRTLVFGGTGMLGRAVVAAARRRGWQALGISHRQGDVADAGRVRYWLGAFRPELLVNCAAFTRVDEAEQRRDEAFAVNGEAAGVLAAAAREERIPLVHVSSDYVFAGGGERRWREEDAPAPLSVYGESKRLGEERALSWDEALVVRSSWLFGPGGRNFVTTIVGLIDRGETPLRVVDDQVGCPTYTPFLAAALCDLAARGARGLVHYANREPVSWYGFAREIAGLWDARAEVAPVPTEAVPRPARRPAYSVLDTDRFSELVGRVPEHWGWGLSEYLDALRRERAQQEARVR
ncbi:MAG TPA: dTDP-4-dehydrorhamnose reductase [Thermoanaerobaculia bacterium]|nr:dTDP-4-dehydrorhamnose reductase [Thermoanaerobaculia bacterium]